MIDDGMRRGLLDQFPNVPVTVLATRPAFYMAEAVRRPHVIVRAIDAPAPAAPPAIDGGNVVIDGLEDLDEPAAFLRDVRRATSGARLFALIANAAYAGALADFLAGGSLGAAHPLVEAELDRLVADGGWRLLDRIPLPDPAIPEQPVPYTIARSGVALTVSTADMSARLRTTGFLIVADPQ